MSGPVLTGADLHALEQLREAWKHFDGQMMIDREHAELSLLDALRGFVESTIKLKKEYEAFRRAQYLRREGEPPEVAASALTVAASGVLTVRACGVCGKGIDVCPGHSFGEIKLAGAK